MQPPKIRLLSQNKNHSEQKLPVQYPLIPDNSDPTKQVILSSYVESVPDDHGEHEYRQVQEWE